MTSISATQSITFQQDQDAHFVDITTPTPHNFDLFLQNNPESFFLASDAGLDWPHYEPKDDFKQVSESLQFEPSAFVTDLVPQTIATV
jgi:hypothetical protein